MLNACGVSFLTDGNILELSVYAHFEYTKIDFILHHAMDKIVNFMLCSFYLKLFFQVLPFSYFTSNVRAPVSLENFWQLM